MTVAYFSLSLNERFKTVDREEYNVISLEEIESIYDKYISILFGVAFRIVNDKAVAEEILKQTFLDIRQNYTDYDNSKQSRLQWMINITRKTARQKISFESFLQNHRNSDYLNNYRSNSNGNTDYDNSRLTIEQNMILDLVFFGGGKVNEIAKQLQMDETKVKRLLREALNHYREPIQETQWK